MKQDLVKIVQRIILLAEPQRNCVELVRQKLLSLSQLTCIGHNKDPVPKMVFQAAGHHVSSVLAKAQNAFTFFKSLCCAHYT